MMIMSESCGFGRKLALGIAFCALGACTSSGTNATGTGGSGQASGGTTGGGGSAATTGSSGGSTGLGGSLTGAGGDISSTGLGGSLTGAGGDTSTGGAGPGTGGDGPGGALGAGGSGRGGSGAVGSGGSAGGTAGGAGAGGGGSGTCNAVFCDDFEASTTLGAAWTVDKVAANVVEVVSTMAPHSGSSGKNTVHMHFTTASGATFIHESMGFPAPMNTVWGRVWFYVMNDPTSNGHDVYIEAADVLSTNTGVRPLNTQSGKMAINVDPGLNANEDGANAMLVPGITSTAIPRGVWTCFEWSIIAPTTGSGSVTLYMGGAQLATIAKTKVPALMFQRVGYEHYNGDSAAGDLWIDDYAVGTKRITCN
jgi:hypothetical protein